MNINWTPAMLGEILDKTRNDTSLGLLTKKFVDVLRRAPSLPVDLNEAAEHLAVQKRRVYDITNILEGIGLVEKIARNLIKWRGTASNEKSKIQNNHGLLHKLCQEIAAIQDEEKNLEDTINICRQELQIITTDNIMAKDAYVTISDIEAIEEFDNHSIIIIQADPGTILEVPHCKQGIFLYLCGSQKPPLVNWIYRNATHDSLLPVQEVSSDILHGIYHKKQTTSMTDDIVQQAITMDLSLDTSLFTPLNHGPPVCAPLSLGHGPQLDIMYNQPCDYQQPISDLFNDVIACQENTSFDQLALDLMMNPPIGEHQHDIINNNSNNNNDNSNKSSNSNNSLYNLQTQQAENDLLRLLLLQYPSLTPPDSYSTNSSPLDDIDTLSPLSSHIADDLFDYTMNVNKELEEFI